MAFIEYGSQPNPNDPALRGRKTRFTGTTNEPMWEYVPGEEIAKVKAVPVRPQTGDGRDFAAKGIQSALQDVQANALSPREMQESLQDINYTGDALAATSALGRNKPPITAAAASIPDTDASDIDLGLAAALNQGAAASPAPPILDTDPSDSDPRLAGLSGQSGMEQALNEGFGAKLDAAGDAGVGKIRDAVVTLLELFQRGSPERDSNIEGVNKFAGDIQANTTGKVGTLAQDAIDSVGGFLSGIFDDIQPTNTVPRVSQPIPPPAPAQAAVAEAATPTPTVTPPSTPTSAADTTVGAPSPEVAPIDQQEILAPVPPLPPPQAPGDIESADLAGRVKAKKEEAFGRVTVPIEAERFGMSKEQVLDFAQAMIDENPDLITEGEAGIARRLQGFDPELILIIQDVIFQLNNPGETGTDLG